MSTEDRCSPTETTKWCLQGLWRSVCGVYGSFAASTLTDTPPPEFRPGQNMTCMYCSPPACCQHRCSATTQQNYKSCRWNYERARAVRRRHSPTANSSIKVTKFYFSHWWKDKSGQIKQASVWLLSYDLLLRFHFQQTAPGRNMCIFRKHHIFPNLCSNYNFFSNQLCN